ncbi:MAG: hypothetical protein ACFCUH_05205 [Flavobacteriales bacterium]
MGYTTAGAYTHFDDLKFRNSDKVGIGANELNRLSEMIKNARESRHHQMKLGTSNIFALFHYAGKDNEDRVVFNIGSESVFVVNLSNMRQYEITHRPDIVWIEALIDEMQ